VCLNACELLNDLGMTPDEIAQKVFSDQVSDNLLSAIQRCDLCGRCGEGCLVNLNPADMFRAAREVLMRRGVTLPDDYDVMLVDQDWNFFSLYRSTFNIQFDDLYLDKYDTLFFPGCSLASYAPELTRAVHSWLQGQGMRVGFTEKCCGKPLSSIGLEERARNLLDGIREEMQTAGAKRLVTACPNCHYLLKEQLGGVELVSLYDLLREAGIQVQGDERFTVHDSCADRYDMAIGTQIRALLSSHPLVEMEHHGKDTLCCGSGGIVSTVAPKLAEQRARKRVAEFSDTGADRCVTACMSCAHRLARVSSEGNIVHCLELVFGIPVDYSQLAANIQSMWKGEWGEYNLSRLSQAKLITGKGAQ
jgi:Fe-S oxidoreductase